MIRKASLFFFVIEIAVLSLLIFGCDTTIIPTDHSTDVTTLHSYTQDTGFSCPDNPGLGNNHSLDQLCFDLLSDTLDGNTASAPLPILSVLNLFTENATDSALMELRSKIPGTFLKVESAARQNLSWYNGIKIESIFWGQRGYLFSIDFLNTLSCNGTRLKAVDFARSGDDFPYTLSGYLHSLPAAFNDLSFSEPDHIDSVRSVITSSFYITSLFNPSVVEDTNCEGTFQNKTGNTVVTRGIRFKKGLKTYQDSPSIVYDVALTDTSLLMYVFTGTIDSSRHTLQEILNGQISFHTDTTNQLWLPFVSIIDQCNDFNSWFSAPINDTTVDYGYINNNGALRLSDVTYGVFFSLSSNLTVASNAAAWLKATWKEERSNWNHGEMGFGMDCDVHFGYYSCTAPDCGPFMVALIHKETNSVLCVASVKTVTGTPYRCSE